MKRKYEEIEEEPVKKVKLIIKKRERENYNNNNQSAEAEDDDVIEIIKKGVNQKIKLQYNFIKIDRTKVPTYIL